MIQEHRAVWTGDNCLIEGQR